MASVGDMALDSIGRMGATGAGAPGGLARVSRDRVGDERDSFASVMGRVSATTDPRTNTSGEKDEARESAEELVAIALVQPILSQMRSSNQAAEPFKPNEAERTFGSMMDAILARRLVHSSNWGLVDTMAQRLRRDGVAPQVGIRVERTA